MKKSFLDRKDGYRIKDMTGMNQILIDLKPRRCDSDVYINQDMDITELVNYMDKLKKDGKSVTYFHAFLTALGKTIYNRNKLNRFVQNRHLFEHKEIVISFVAKVSFDDKSEEIMVLVPINEDDNIFTISEFVKNKVDEIREKKSKKEGANNAIDFLGKLPNIIRIPLIGIFKWLDRIDLLPSSLIKDNLYYSSVIVSNLGSIKCDAIYHNLTNLGTCTGLITMGEIKTKEVINDKGKKEIRKFCSFGINLDERIADGYYMAKSMKLLERILNNPSMLESKISEKIEVEENR
ncbi:MAG: 2-oxo acid dehydrogenase subunit E2 [Bacilli bacterium]|nr:2-oxo acid dehydrogenase subunit E2 [Bacilli bacterium]